MTSTRSLIGAAALAAPLLLALAPAARADDFIRGDANGDGLVTLADVAAVNAYLFWGLDPRCGAAADYDDDGGLGLEDLFGLEAFLLGPGGPPAAPYPEPGPDAGGDGPMNRCESYGSAPPLEDPAALIRIHDAVALGGDDVHATIRVSIAHSVPIWSFFGAVEIGAELVEDAWALGKDGALDVLLADHSGRTSSFRSAQVKDGRLQFGMFLHDEGGLPPRDESDALAIKVCLRGGLPAGDYPLTLVYGDFSRGPGPGEDRENPEFGRVILPALESATLTVLEDVQEYSTCRVRPLDGVNVRFWLGEAAGVVGGSVGVPMFVNGDREGHGFGFGVLFDNELLEATHIEQVFTRPDELPFVDEFSEIDNEGGAVRGFWKSSSHSERHFLPPYQDNPVVVLYFRIKKFAESIDLRFDREYRLTTYKAFDDNYTPETASSFVLVDTTIRVVPDISLFIRGDTNGDTLVNIADVQATLNFLFIGGRPPYCLDGADANDDGVVDISDAIRMLDYLFRDATKVLPPPNGSPGPDPTEDGLACLRR